MSAERHPLRDRAIVCPTVGTLKYKKTARLTKHPEIQISRLQHAYRQLPPSSEAAKALPKLVYTEQLGTKIKGIEDHLQWVRTVPVTEICAYSDGSSGGHGRSSWGYILQRQDKTFHPGRGIVRKLIVILIFTVSFGIR